MKNSKGTKSKVCRSRKTLKQSDDKASPSGDNCVSNKVENVENISCDTSASEVSHESIDSRNENILQIENVVGNFVEHTVNPCDNVGKRRKKKKYYVFNIVVNTDTATPSPPNTTTSSTDKASVESNATETRPMNLSEETIKNIANEVVRNLSTYKKCFKNSSSLANRVGESTSSNAVPSVCATVKGKEQSSLFFVENKASSSISPLEVIGANLPQTSDNYDIGEITNGKVEWAKKCTTCGVFFGTVEKLENHKCLRCVGCKLYFQTASELKTHETSCKLSVKIAKPIPRCQTCNLRFKSEIKLVKHKKACNICKICAKVLTKGYSKHMAGHEKNPLNCVKCTVSFATKRELDDHKLSCTGREHAKARLKTVVCEICGKVVKRKNFKKHKEAHENLKQYKCPLCPKRFNSTNTRANHKKKVHLKKYLKYVCSYCGLKSQSKSHIIEHEESHKVPEGEPILTPYACECGKAFVTKFELNRHRFCFHVQKKCSECGEEFNGSIQLYRHINRIHKQRQCRKCLAEAKINGAQPAQCVHRKNTEYCCHLCGLPFPTLNFKLRHMRRYHDDGSFKIEVVDHAGVRKIFEKTGDVFVCDVCGKEFARLNSFKEHVLLAHHPGRQFACQLCESRFKRKGDLTRHVKDSHGNAAENDEAPQGENVFLDV